MFGLCSSLRWVKLNSCGFVINHFILPMWYFGVNSLPLSFPTIFPLKTYAQFLDGKQILSLLNGNLLFLHGYIVVALQESDASIWNSESFVWISPWNSDLFIFYCLLLKAWFLVIRFISFVSAVNFMQDNVLPYITSSEGISFRYIRWMSSDIRRL